MKTWHWRRIKIPLKFKWFDLDRTPFQAQAGNWVFFYIEYKHDATKSIYRTTHMPMTTIGLDGVE